MAATPPMRTAVQIPPTPLHGGRYDTYYPTRRSTRNTTRITRVNHTPPPPSDNLSHGTQSSSKNKSSTNQSTATIHSPPPSTHTSPHKRAKKNGHSEAASTLDGNDLSRAASFDPFYDLGHNLTLENPSLNLAASMLPTPVKTPRKKPIGQSSMNAGGRVLFPDRAEDPMPTPRKNRKGGRHVGFSLYGSTEDGDEAAENGIAIYTDSKDKVPELDPSEDNPFLDKPSEAAPAPEPSKARISKKRKSGYGLDGSKEIEEAFNREEGMVYVFRGKKVYRKFPNEDPNAEDEDEPTAATVGDLDSPISRTLTRSSIKPRLLFPTTLQKAKRSKSDLEDEEATTDVDDPDQTESEEKEQEKLTPVKPIFAPATPPDTSHATRAATKKAAANEGSSSPPLISPVPLDFRKPTNKKVSPFDGWARTKPSASAAAAGKGKKRGAEALQDDNEGGAEGGPEVEGTSKKAKAHAA